MNSRFACLIAVTVALAAAAPAVMSASTPPRALEAVDILVDGAAQPQFAHGGRWYVEARKGREYAIRLRNPYPVRVAVALSVDGLNTIDARETTAAGARKWVIGPYETVVISGWQTSQSEARRFEFTTEDKSYGQALGKTANLGVISAVFFKERVAPAYTENRRKDQTRQEPAAPAAASDSAKAKRENEEYAATGMGRSTDHAVQQVWLNLEDAPSHVVNIRYEFRPQLVKLGVLPAPVPTIDPLSRRERARGFCPIP